jgi:hypothetical protein
MIVNENVGARPPVAGRSFNRECLAARPARERSHRIVDIPRLTGKRRRPLVTQMMGRRIERIETGEIKNKA